MIDISQAHVHCTRPSWISGCPLSGHEAPVGEKARKVTWTRHVCWRGGEGWNVRIIVGR